MNFLGRHLRLGGTQRNATAPLLAPGTQVGTPDGVGVVDRIELALLQIGDHVELDVPHVFVRLSGSDTITQVCLCKITLPDKVAQEALHAEYSRLWPPLPETDEAMPPALQASLREVGVGAARTARRAAQLLIHTPEARGLLRAAVTAATLRNPRNQPKLERVEHTILSYMRNKDHA